MTANRTFACTICGYLRRSASPDFDVGTDSPAWPRHCGESMQLLGYRSSQAATQLKPSERVAWLSLGARVIEGKGRKKWKPVVSETQLKDAYPLV